MLFHYHDGVADFPHGAGASDEGWYIYADMADVEPVGPLIAEYIVTGFTDDCTHYWLEHEYGKSDALPYISQSHLGCTFSKP